MKAKTKVSVRKFKVTLYREEFREVVVLAKNPQKAKEFAVTVEDHYLYRNKNIISGGDWQEADLGITDSIVEEVS